MANNRRKFNSIQTIKVNGQVYGEESLMKKARVHFYENLLHDGHHQRPLLDGIFYETITMEDALELEKGSSE